METDSEIRTEVETHNRVLKLMGNRFEISVVSDDEDWAMQRIDDAVEEISRIERFLTTFNDASKTQEINLNAGIKPVIVDKEIFALIQRSLNISKLDRKSTRLN